MTAWHNLDDGQLKSLCKWLDYAEQHCQRRLMWCVERCEKSNWQCQVHELAQVQCEIRQIVIGRQAPYKPGLYT